MLKYVNETEKKIFKCDNEACPRPGCYRSFKSDKDEGFPCERVGCMGRYRLIRLGFFITHCLAMFHLWIAQVMIF